MLTVPDTIIRSECLGEAHGTIPRRSTSKREANVAIISVAQHASPDVTGHTEDLRAQLRKLSATVVRAKPPGKWRSPSVTLSKTLECLSPCWRSWWNFSHSCRSLNSVHTGGGICGVGA